MLSSNRGAGLITPQTPHPLARDTMPNRCDSVSFFLATLCPPYNLLWRGSPHPFSTWPIPETLCPAYKPGLILTANTSDSEPDSGSSFAWYEIQGCTSAMELDIRNINVLKLLRRAFYDLIIAVKLLVQIYNLICWGFLYNLCVMELNVKEW